MSSNFENSQGASSQPSQNILTQNQYSVLADVDDVQMATQSPPMQNDSVFDNDVFKLVRNSKRPRIGTGSSVNSTHMSLQEYNSLTIDEKMSALFSEMCTSRVKMEDIDHKLDSITQLQGKVDVIESQVCYHADRLKFLEYRALHLETKSRKNNLIFYGFDEQKGENCRTRIVDFLAENFVEEWPFRIERAYRLGPYD
ncbi:uncharacterized protein LOC128547015 [Mercenaria mercenaria]|uniref:uncharacterized protein LOC128547015 n=1 Tax=Mercenaria mercenaria TaxID=6596 RepID=UPI00234EB798|nr:uncharacterized protein LOC128547015 [Mercenaria mercenaria]